MLLCELQIAPGGSSPTKVHQESGTHKPLPAKGSGIVQLTSSGVSTRHQVAAAATASGLGNIYSHISNIAKLHINNDLLLDLIFDKSS